MIIICPCGEKKFEVDSNLIPEKGRMLKCGSCDQTWFYGPNERSSSNILKDLKAEEKFELPKENNENIHINEQKINKSKKIKKSSNFGVGKILSYLIVAIISFIALILILETFKSELSNIFPGLEFILYSLFETIKDMLLFFKNLFI
tara:strand:+ start:137 stop:577 length:441 start_codon:yes stop_codon:yes gene_type:complete